MKKVAALLLLCCTATLLYGRDRRTRFGPGLSFYSEYREAIERKRNHAYKLTQLYKSDRAGYQRELHTLLKRHLNVPADKRLPLKFSLNFHQLCWGHFIRLKYYGWKYKNIKILDSPLLPVTVDTMPRLTLAIREIAQKFGFTKPVTAFITDQPLYLAATAGMWRDYGVIILSPADLYAPDDEGALAMIGHELGHIHHRHALRSSIIGGTSLSVTLGILETLRKKTFPQEKGIFNQILLWTNPLIGIACLIFLERPFSRQLERQADAASAQVTNPRFGRKLFQYHLKTSPPKKTNAFRRFFATHPSYEERAAFFESQVPVWDAKHK